MSKADSRHAAWLGVTDTYYQRHRTRQLPAHASDETRLSARRLDAEKQVKGFQTGDMLKAIVPIGKKVGTHTGRVAVRKTGSFNIQIKQSDVYGIAHK